MRILKNTMRYLKKRFQKKIEFLSWSKYKNLVDTASEHQWRQRVRNSKLANAASASEKF